MKSTIKPKLRKVHLRLYYEALLARLSRQSAEDAGEVKGIEFAIKLFKEHDLVRLSSWRWGNETKPRA